MPGRGQEEIYDELEQAAEAAGGKFLLGAIGLHTGRRPLSDLSVCRENRRQMTATPIHWYCADYKGLCFYRGYGTKQEKEYWQKRREAFSRNI